MQGISQALGVRCQFCHVDDDPGRENDMASDEKAPKNTARAMMRFTADLNARLARALGKPAAEITQVQCATCHRGVPIPKQITEILSETAAQKGMPAATDQYRDLRKRYYGGQSYDFSEGALVSFAQREIQADKADDALQYLQLNLEFYPEVGAHVSGNGAGLQPEGRQGPGDQERREGAARSSPKTGWPSGCSSSSRSENSKVRRVLASHLFVASHAEMAVISAALSFPPNAGMSAIGSTADGSVIQRSNQAAS